MDFMNGLGVPDFGKKMQEQGGQDLEKIQEQGGFDSQKMQEQGGWDPKEMLDGLFPKTDCEVSEGELVKMQEVVSKILDGLFPKTGYTVSEEEFAKMQKCAEMLEKYVPIVPKNAGCAKFDPYDMDKWLNDFFKTLVHGGPELLDDQFYTGNKNNESNLGIGTDGEFTCEELFQFMYRLYKAIASYKIQKGSVTAIMQNAELFACAEMLEKYVDRFSKTKVRVKLGGKDASDWKDRYFHGLVEGGPKLPDYTFFSSNNKNCGIGIDGEFSAVELFQFMYRLYKEIVNKLG